MCFRLIIHIHILYKTIVSYKQDVEGQRNKKSFLRKLQIITIFCITAQVSRIDPVSSCPKFFINNETELNIIPRVWKELRKMHMCHMHWLMSISLIVTVKLCWGNSWACSLMKQFHQTFGVWWLPRHQSEIRLRVSPAWPPRVKS